MHVYIGNTDFEWYQHLLQLSSAPDGLDEVNFWKPSGNASFKALSFGEPLFFKLKKRYGHVVVGFGLFAAFRKLSISEAWTAFGEANGAPTQEAVQARVAKYVSKLSPEAAARHRIGCILLAAPHFFPREMWIDGPANWSDNTVSGAGHKAGYNTSAGEGQRLWRECLERAELLGKALDLAPTGATRQPGVTAPLFPTDPPTWYGSEQVVRPRLGQGTFRYALEQAYTRCAVTGEHSLPALDAAHIVPFSEGGEHVLENGLLLRADVHRLYDRGYVTVTPDYCFRVSSRLREDYDNGKAYYQHDGQTIWTPASPWPKPAPELLERQSQRFLG